MHTRCVDLRILLNCLQIVNVIKHSNAMLITCHFTEQMLKRVFNNINGYNFIDMLVANNHYTKHQSK